MKYGISIHGQHERYEPEALTKWPLLQRDDSIRPSNTPSGEGLENDSRHS